MQLAYVINVYILNSDILIVCMAASVHAQARYTAVCVCVCRLAATSAQGSMKCKVRVSIGF